MALRPTSLLVVALLGTSALPAAIAPATVYAQEEGVTLDPGDPAANEYALPSEQARREASGATGRVRQGGGNSALFGEGVSEDGDSAAATGTADAKSSAADSTDDSGADDRAGTPAATGNSSDGNGSAATTTEASAGGIGSTTALVGGAALALVAAGMGGLALRATRGPSDG